MSILLPISSFSAAPAAAAPKPPPDPEWEAAAKLFKQRHWADAEKPSSNTRGGHHHRDGRRRW
jgi:hypothetical protein